MFNLEAGARVAAAIGAIKWVLIGLASVVTISGVAGVALENDTSAALAVTVALATVAGGAAFCLLTWVVFGWFEHSLLALVAIARNTAMTPANGGTTTQPTSR